MMTERPIPHLQVVPEPAAMATQPCQRCGGRDRLWTFTTATERDELTYYRAHLCGICTRSVLAEVEAMAPYTEPVTVVMTLTYRL